MQESLRSGTICRAVLTVLHADCKPSYICYNFGGSQDFMNGVATNIIHLQLKKLKYYGGARCRQTAETLVYSKEILYAFLLHS